MIELKVISLQGAPLAQPLSARFGPGGGTIGRSSTNTLVLDDRTVSRVHAQVECRDGRYFITDRGSNPLHHNGMALGSGREALLGPGDRLQVGSFELSVQASAVGAAPAPARESAGPPMAGAPAAFAPRPSSDDPFADLLAGLGNSQVGGPPGGHGAPGVAGAPAGASRQAPSAEPSMFPDPMGIGAAPMMPAASPASVDDPFADLLGPGQDAGGGAGISAGFADLGLRPNSPAIGIDDLFGGLGAQGGAGNDPIPAPPMRESPAPPAGAPPLDNPFEAVQGWRKPSTPTREDHLPIERFGFEPPKVVGAPSPKSGGALLDGLDIEHVAQPPARPDDAGSLPLGTGTPQDDPFADLMPPASPVASPVAAPAQARQAIATGADAFPAPPAAPSTRQPSYAPVATDDALLVAFLHGLGSTHQMPTRLTPELMERIGVLLRGATDGTLQLLHARRELKEGMHAQLTRIEANANNPLKLSPNAEVALPHLLGPGMRGFMGPEDAMRDAYNDLRAHEFGVMVGMKAALAHVLSRFTPAELEKKITARSALDAVFAANRKARLWDQFVALQGSLAAEAEDDFHALFGKAFLQAYEEQMARLKSGR